MFKGTTICAVCRDGVTAIAGDGQEKDTICLKALQYVQYAEMELLL